MEKQFSAFIRYLAYDISYRGKTIRIFPGVFSPKYDWSGKFAVDCLPSLRGMSFLEIGAGCGIVSVFAALAGFRRHISDLCEQHEVQLQRSPALECSCHSG
jgi:16S rRNA G1207 methylase RsmC